MVATFGLSKLIFSLMRFSRKRQVVVDVVVVVVVVVDETDKGGGRMVKEDTAVGAMRRVVRRNFMVLTYDI